MSTKNRLMAIALVSCAAFGSSAYASDFKVMPGSACQPRTPSDLDDIVTLMDGVTNINQSDEAFVVCPIVRDNARTNPNPKGTLLVNLLVKGSSNDEPVECLLDSRKSNGTVDPMTNLPLDRDEGSAGGAAIGTDKGFRQLILEVKQNPRNDGYYVVQCEVPPGSPGGTVVSYLYVETSPTDENN